MYCQGLIPESVHTRQALYHLGVVLLEHELKRFLLADRTFTQQEWSRHSCQMHIECSPEQTLFEPMRKAPISVKEPKS